MQSDWKHKYLRYKSFLLNTVDRYEERTDVRIYLEILLSLITISVFSIFALRPTILTIAELIKEIEAKEELVDKLNSKIETVTSAQVLYDRERDNVELLKKSIPPSPEVDTLVYQLEGLVQKNNLSTRGLAISETPLLPTNDPTPANQPKVEQTALEFSVSLVGDYLSLFDFVGDVEILLKPIDIIGSSIRSQENEETGEITLILTLSGKMPYSYKIKETDKQ